MRGHQHAVRPGAAVGVQWFGVAGGSRGETQLASDGQQHRRAFAGGQFDLTCKQRNLCAVGKLPHIEPCAPGFQNALRGVYFERLRGRQEDFAFQQADQPLIDAHVCRTARVQLQLIVRPQPDLATLANRAAVIGEQRRQRIVLAQAPGGGRTGAENQQQFQCLTSAAGLRPVQCRMRQR